MLRVVSLLFAALAWAQPPSAPPRWVPLIGEYQRGDGVVHVFEQDGRLWMLSDRQPAAQLEESAANRFRVPGAIQSQREVEFTAAGLRIGSDFFRRLPVPDSRITPLKPVSELREAVRGQSPMIRGDFVPPILVELRRLDPTIRLDIRYAGTNNFLGTPFYTQARAFLAKPAAEALVRAHRALGARGYGLLIHDGYRPWSVTKMFWDATPDDKKEFVANPAQGSRHNRGCAVDLSLFDRATGAPVEMPGGYDEMSERSYVTYPGGTSRQRWFRDLLRTAMEREGFRVYSHEWWHFDYSVCPYSVMNVAFEEIAPEK